MNANDKAQDKKTRRDKKNEEKLKNNKRRGQRKLKHQLRDLEGGSNE